MGLWLRFFWDFEFDIAPDFPTSARITLVDYLPFSSTRKPLEDNVLRGPLSGFTELDCVLPTSSLPLENDCVDGLKNLSLSEDPLFEQED